MKFRPDLRFFGYQNECRQPILGHQKSAAKPGPRVFEAGAARAMLGQALETFHVGGFTDLGAIFNETGKIMFPWCFHGLEHRNRCNIVSYGDLLLPRHRWFAQIAIDASGEHTEDASAVKQSPRRSLVLEFRAESPHLRTEASPVLSAAEPRADWTPPGRLLDRRGVFSMLS